MDNIFKKIALEMCIKLIVEHDKKTMEKTLEEIGVKGNVRYSVTIDEIDIEALEKAIAEHNNEQDYGSKISILQNFLNN